MNNRQLDELRSMEAFEDEVELLAEERGITFSAALALKTGEAAPTATTKKRTAMAEADLEELREGMRELQERSLSNLEMACGREFTEMCEDGTIERRAREKGIPYQDAFAELQEEAYRPLTEAEMRRSVMGYGTTPVEHDDEEAARLSIETLGKTGEPPRVEFDEAALDRRARAYAEKHGVGYGVALEAVLGEV